MGRGQRGGGFSDGSVGVWELASRRKLWHGIAHKDKTAAGTTAVAFAPDGKHVASAGLDKTAAVWPVAGGPSVKRFIHESPVLAVAFVSGGSQVVTGVKDSTIRVWDVETGNPLRTLKAAAPVHCLAVQREDKYLIAGGLNGNLQLVVLKDALSDPSLRDTPPEAKYPMPESADLQAATLAIRNAYRTQFESEKTEEREALLDRLMVRAVGKESVAARFALFREAHDLAARLGKVPAAYKAVDEMGKWFQIDAFAEKVSTLTTAAADAPPAAQKGVLDAVNALFATAEKEGRADAVKQLLQAMTQSAAKSGNAALVKQVDDFQKKRVADADLNDRVAKLKAKLKEKPDDPDANLAYGLILCAADKWKDGLPMLAKGADKALAAVARRRTRPAPRSSRDGRPGKRVVDARQGRRRGQGRLLHAGETLVRPDEAGRHRPGQARPRHAHQPDRRTVGQVQEARHRHGQHEQAAAEAGGVRDPDELQHRSERSDVQERVENRRRVARRIRRHPSGQRQGRDHIGVPAHRQLETRHYSGSGDA